MSLPDVSKMVPPSHALWRALGTRLRTIGVTLSRAQEVTQIGVFMLDAARAPIRKWHLRRMHDPAGYAMRMLMFDDAVSRAEAESALGEVPLDPFIDAGYLRRLDDGNYVSPFNLNPLGDIFVICDHLSHGDDAVMGAGQTTTFMCDASKPSRRLARGLDVGCGAGTGALSLASQVDRVIGTDINMRAIALSRINAEINGIGNVEFREGDMFAPVAGETFDIIISQPPFVSAPPGLAVASFEYGGPRGDELPLRLLREIPAYLANNGRAVILAEWPELAGETVEQHIRAALPAPDLKILILQCPGSSLNDYCAIYAAADHPNLGAEFERDTLLRREHLETMGIRGLRVAINILQHAAEPPTGWTAAVDIQGAGQIILTSARIDKMIAARDLATRGERAMLAARLRVPEGTAFIEERSGLEASAKSKLMARLSPWLLVRPAELNADALRLLALVHQSPTVKDAAERFQPPVELAKIMATVQYFLLYGLLEIA
jgi:SAM-dependent methyltransferase